jgi:uncharacterized delta-60 repeat protein
MISPYRFRFKSQGSFALAALGLFFFVTGSPGIEVPGFGSLAPGGGFLVSGSVQFAEGYRSVAIAKLQQDGGLDPGFGVGGRSVYDFFSDGLSEIRHSMDAKRRIIATCVAYLPTPSGNRPFAVAIRFHADGSLDEGFGDGGVFTFSEGPLPEFLLTVASDDGKILFVGPSQLIRLNEDGSRDSTFGSDGVAPIGNNLRGMDRAILLQDGRILLSRRSDGIIAISQTGQVDPAFVNPRSHLLSSYRIMCQQADGKIVIAEASWASFGERTRFSRFELSGSLDMGFGTNGFYEPPHPAFYPIQILGSTDGGVVGVANREFSPTASYSSWVFRFGEDGSPDSNFGLVNARGERFDIDDAVNVRGDGIQSVVPLQSGGYLVVAKEGSGLDGCRVTRLLPDGSPVTAGGRPVTSFFKFSFPKPLLSSLPIDREYGLAGEYRVPIARPVKTYRARSERRKRFLVYAAECGVGPWHYRVSLNADEDGAARLRVIYAGGGEMFYVPDDNARYTLGTNGHLRYLRPYKTARLLVQFGRSPRGTGESFGHLSLQGANHGAKTSLQFRILNPSEAPKPQPGLVSPRFQLSE